MGRRKKFSQDSSSLSLAMKDYNSSRATVIDSYKPEDRGRLSRSDAEPSSNPRKRKRRTLPSPGSMGSWSHSSNEPASSSHNHSLYDCVTRLSAQMNRLEDKLDQILEEIQNHKSSPNEASLMPTISKNNATSNDNRFQLLPFRMDIDPPVSSPCSLRAPSFPADSNTAQLNQIVPPTASISSFCETVLQPELITSTAATRYVPIRVKMIPDFAKVSSSLPAPSPSFEPLKNPARGFWGVASSNGSCTSAQNPWAGNCVSFGG